MAIQSVDTIKNTIKVDMNGRPIMSDSPSSTKLDANNRIYQEPPPKEETPAADVATEEAPKNPDAEARKLFLEAQRTKRKADEDAKKSKEGLAKASAIEAAVKLAENGEDPTAVLKAAGLDPIKFYQNLTSYALKSTEKPVDPVQAKLDDHEKRLQQYAKDLEVKTITLQQKEELAAHNQVLSQKVIPMLQQNPDRYETIMLEYKENTAAQIYQTVWDIYQETGKARSFEEVADELEAYWFDKVESGYNSASKLKKFQARYGAPVWTSKDIPSEQQEIPQRSKTLTNKPISSSSRTPRTGPWNRQAFVDDVIKKFGG